MFLSLLQCISTLECHRQFASSQYLPVSCKKNWVLNLFTEEKLVGEVLTYLFVQWQSPVSLYDIFFRRFYTKNKHFKHTTELIGAQAILLDCPSGTFEVCL